MHLIDLSNRLDAPILRPRAGIYLLSVVHLSGIADVLSFPGFGGSGHLLVRAYKRSSNESFFKLAPAGDVQYDVEIR